MKLHEVLSAKLESTEQSIPFPLKKAWWVSDELKKERVVGLQAYLAGVLDMVIATQHPLPQELLQFIGAS